MAWKGEIQLKFCLNLILYAQLAVLWLFFLQHLCPCLANFLKNKGQHNHKSDIFQLLFKDLEKKEMLRGEGFEKRGDEKRLLAGGTVRI